MNEDERIIYTIGHSNHTIELFLDLIKNQGINCIIDIRSIPFSNYVPQFNKDILKISLKNNNIIYLHFGKEFGAKITDKNLLDEEGRVDFQKVYKSQIFINGVKRIDDGLNKNYKMALMCTEADPLDCHRFSMVSHFLSVAGMKIFHILKNQTLEDNESVEQRLLNKFMDQIPKSDLFNPEVKRENQLNEAYKLINKEIGYREINGESEQP